MQRAQAVAGLLSASLLAATHTSVAQGVDIVALTSNSERGDGRFGHSVHDAGDVDRDGYPDVIVGAPFDGEGGRGKVYVFGGRDAALLLEIAPPNPGAAVGFGYAVAGAGDVNLDGHADLLVGATREDPGNARDRALAPDAFIGRAYIMSGADGSLLFELETGRGMQGLALAGSSVAAAGDVDRDGVPDVIVGTGWATAVQDPRSCGRAYVFSGRDGGLIFEFIPPNRQKEGQFGHAVGGLGDVDHDGHADLIVGAWGEGGNTGPEFAGRAYVFRGRDGTLLRELVSPNEETLGAFGWSVAAVGDVDQDGTLDALVGAPGEDPGATPGDAGRAYVFSGQDGSPLLELRSPREEARGLFGWSAAGAGDVDGDGHADAIVGAFREDPGSTPESAGRAYVIGGRDGNLLVELRSPRQEANGHFGHSVSGAGDVDNDGHADVVVGAPGEDGLRGRAYLWLSSGRQALDPAGRRPSEPRTERKAP